MRFKFSKFFIKFFEQLSFLECVKNSQRCLITEARSTIDQCWYMCICEYIDTPTTSVFYVYTLSIFIFSPTRATYFFRLSAELTSGNEKAYATASIGKLFKANNAQRLEIIRAWLMAPQRLVLNHMIPGCSMMSDYRWSSRYTLLLKSA